MKNKSLKLLILSLLALAVLPSACKKEEPATTTEAVQEAADDAADATADAIEDAGDQIEQATDQ